MCLDDREFEYCDLYCLPQAVETDPALNQESQMVVKQQHFSGADKINRNQVCVMLL